MIYVAVVWCSTLLQSCRDLSYDASICNIEFRALKQDQQAVLPDTMLSEFKFQIKAYPNQTCFTRPTLHLINRCYATKKCAIWQNDLVPTSFALKLSKPCSLSGNVIPAQTDLFTVNGFKQHIQISKSSSDCFFITYDLIFNPDSLSSLSFEPGVYTAEFTCNTTDQKIMSNQTEVVLKL